MAKKKRRFDKQKSKPSTRKAQPSPKDVHHMLFIGSEYRGKWESRLRNHWYCKVLVDRDTLHREIHKNLARVPPPKPTNCKMAYEILCDLARRGALKDEHSILTRLNLLICILDYIEPETARALKEQYAIAEKCLR